MPGTHIKYLRETGDLDNALALAETEFRENPNNIWTRRNLSWVLVDLMKQHTDAEQLVLFINLIQRIREVGLPDNEIVFYDTFCWRIGKMAMELSKSRAHVLKAYDLFQAITGIPFPRPSKAFSYLFISMHKCLKNRRVYSEFANWWNFRNFLPPDYDSIHMDAGGTIMPIAEQAFVHYSKCLFGYSPLAPSKSSDEEKKAEIPRIRAFLSFLSELTETYPDNDGIPYLIARMHADLGEKQRALSIIQRSAKSNRNRIWIWKLLADCSSDDPDLALAFLCRALAVQTRESHKKGCRYFIAELLRDRGMFDEARTEVDLAVQEAQKNRRFLGKRLRALISEEWYPKAKYLGSNESLYRKHLFRADQFLDGDLGIDRVLVEFVNSKRKMLHFISMDGRAGFLQYGRLTPKVSIGDILEIRFKGALQSGLNHAVFIRPVTTDLKNNTFFKHIHGTLRFDSRSTYGKIGDVSVHPSLIRGFHLADGMQVEGIAIRYHHKVKGEIGWKAHVLSRISPERV